MIRLSKQQKQAVIAWAAEGLEIGEINARASVFKPSFRVSPQQADYYRKRSQVNIDAIRASGEMDALTSGLAVRAARVVRLARLAELLELDLFGDRLWLDQVKSIGSGPFAREVDYEEFNAAGVQQYRGILDDIAKEVGDRKQAVMHSGKVELFTVDIDSDPNANPAP